LEYALANLPNLGKVVSLKGDAATSATKQVARTVSPPRETDGGIFVSKRKFSISANASSEVTMNLVAAAICGASASHSRQPGQQPADEQL
jgi:hypothetical protein